MKILVADDEPMSRRLIEASLLRWQYEVLVAQDGNEALEILQQPDAPKLAVLDWLMPRMDGLEVCRRIRERQGEPYRYIVLLTGKQQRSDVVEGLDAGADDYVIKPFEPDELRVRLRTGKRILYLQDQLISAREALREQATHDSLTGLFNRAAILEILENELARQQRHGGSLGLVLIDVDRFKQVNDIHGHLIGDAVLREVSRAMRLISRPYDAVGRLGGEEFVVVLPGCDRTNAVSHAERMRAAIASIAVPSDAGPVTVTASAGVSTATPGIETDALRLMRAADVALYRAKDNHRNCVMFADDIQPANDVWTPPAAAPTTFISPLGV
ncbi:MAG: diguanylate cyclase [Pirellulales bacterium]|nr:diguanylate cyclase [Pirellulales bacterium]